MLRSNARGYLLAVSIFLVCCWVNPNDAIPYRIRPQIEEQEDQRVDKRAQSSAINVVHRAIGQQDLGADKKPALSGGGKRWSSLQRPRSRIKNMNVNVNSNRMGHISHQIGQLAKIIKSPGRYPKFDQTTSRLVKADNAISVPADHNVSKTSMELLTTERINCSEPHNANDRYSSSFNGNSTIIALNVGDDCQVSGEAGTKKTSSVHVGEDITLCWIETTTIKEDRNFHPIQRFVIREYTISFENSATIPEQYLEYIQLEGEVNGKNTSIPRSALFEVMDENTRQSSVVNFTTVSHSDDLTVWQHRRVRCGVGPVVTKNIIEWADERSDNPKKRVEIKVSPKFHRLSAHPTETEPCTTDFVDPQLNSTSPTSPSPLTDCGPGTTCDSFTDCADEQCGQFIRPNGTSRVPILWEEITQSYTTISYTDNKIDESTNRNDDREFLSTGGPFMPSLVTDEMINFAEEIRTPASAITEITQGDEKLFTVAPAEMTTIVDHRIPMIKSDFEVPSTTESNMLLSVTLNHIYNVPMETGNQEVEVPTISEEFNFNTGELYESCERGDLCVVSSFDSTTNSEEDTATRRDDEPSGTEFTVSPTTDASYVRSSELTTEYGTEYLSTEEWETSDDTTESENSSRVTEISKSNTLAGVTKGRDIIIENQLGDFSTTETMESVANVTELSDFSRTIADTMDSSITTERIRMIIDCEPDSDDCLVLTESTMDQNQTPSIDRVFEETTMLITSESIWNENGTTEVPPVVIVSEVSTTEEKTTKEPAPASCESSENCESSFEDANLENVLAFGGSSTEKCEDGDETVICMSGGFTDMLELRTSGVMDMITTMTTETNFATNGDIRNNDSVESGAVTTTEQVITGISDSATEVTTSSTVLAGKTTAGKIITHTGNATTEATTSTTAFGNETITDETSTEIGDTTIEATWLTTSDAGSTTEETTTTGMHGGTIEATASSTIFDGESATEKKSTNFDGITTDITELLTTVKNQSEITDSLPERVTEIETKPHLEGSTQDVTEATTETNAHTIHHGVETTTEAIILTALLEPDVAASTETIPDSNSTGHNQSIHSFTTEKVTEPVSITEGVTKTVFTTTEATIDVSTHYVDRGSTETTTETVWVNGTQEETTEHDAVSTTQKPTNLTSICDSSTGQCGTTETGDVTSITLPPCNPETESCDSSCEDSNDCSADSLSLPMSCDEESESCPSGSFSLSTTTCNEESGDCIYESSSSSRTCEEDPDDCSSIDSTYSSTMTCDEELSALCTIPRDTERDSMSDDSSEMCDGAGIENCIIFPLTQEVITALPSTTISTPIKVENISTTVSDVLTTVEGRKSTTAIIPSTDTKTDHHLALKIKILLEYIDDNKNKQKLVEVEKHLLFNQHPNEHGQRSLMKQVKSLNDTVSIQTVQALFNCSTVEKLTGDVGDFAAKYLTMHNGMRKDEGPNSNFSSTGDSDVSEIRDLGSPEKSNVDPNVEMSLPGIHDDIHSGLSHVMTWVPSEHGVQRRSVWVSGKNTPYSRILEVIADPQDERVHDRRKRETIDDLTIDEQDVPKDVEEVGHWSNERVRRAINGGHVRTRTEFTIYKGPEAARQI